MFLKMLNMRNVCGRKMNQMPAQCVLVPVVINVVLDVGVTGQIANMIH